MPMSADRVAQTLSCCV